MSTPLHQRMLAFNYGDAKRSTLMEEVWRDTPWMVDAYTGGHYTDGRHEAMIRWCYDTFGEECSAIHGRSGRWHRGGATVYGWTWFGFSTEAEMIAFIERWPVPEGVSVPA